MWVGVLGVGGHGEIESEEGNTGGEKRRKDWPEEKFKRPSGGRGGPGEHTAKKNADRGKGEMRNICNVQPWPLDT